MKLRDANAVICMAPPGRIIIEAFPLLSLFFSGEKKRRKKQREKKSLTKAYI